MKSNRKIRMTFVCNQSWEDMEPTANGRFCELCQHNIRNYSELPLKEILKSNSTNDELCGLFSAEQVYSDIIAPLNTNKIRRATTFFTTLLLLATRPSNGQSKDSLKTEVQFPSSNKQVEQSPIQTMQECDSTLKVNESLEKNKRIELFRIGKRKYYLTKKFPFVHSRRYRLMGRFKY